jgi:hypothetical protein
MFLLAAMTVLVGAGLAFYTRFLLALCKEYKPRWIRYWVRLQPGSGPNVITELQERKRPGTRAA